ncbi:hypothetical protein HaLaN_05553 [Haematococcus lacustris]|uniref:Uncharacterized protein n=1 Tax=Haematococcus lacustris TaxID=44745 RepID=A0A699YL87_HAELA|nr:hypothetical protein HaLaN_05553 [Haematococcus lacustris]
MQLEKEVAEAANVASLARYRRSSLINVNPSEAQLLLPAADLDAAAASSTQPVSAYAGPVQQQGALGSTTRQRRASQLAVGQQGP